MRNRNTIFAILGGLLCLFLSAAACFGQDTPHPTFTTFDVPGDVNGTFPSGINPRGAITGYYSDAITSHGFLRAPNGTITTFDGPGAFFGTFPYDINPQGA